MSLIKPHGGTLINQENFLQQEEIQALDVQNSLSITKRSLNDIEMIATGVFSPLKGFINQANFNSVIERGRLNNDLPFTIPIVLAISEEEKKSFSQKESIYLSHEGSIYAKLQVEDIFKPNKETWVKSVYKTDDVLHPGVAYVNQLPEYLISGEIQQLQPIPKTQFLKFYYTPVETRQLFQQKKWNTIVAFQTRNPIHRAHEYLQKCALEMVDGLFIHPLVGETKSDDIPASVRMDCYQVLLDNYYPTERSVLGVFPAAMNYAGPKEAIFHAICRKNYGCTHFIVGRDHAGVGNYYGTYDAHYIFDDYTPEEIDIVPLKFEHAFYCKNCGGMASQKTCPSKDHEHIFLSGTKVREMLLEGTVPPAEFTRPEVAKILIEAYKK